MQAVAKVRKMKPVHTDGKRGHRARLVSVTRRQQRQLRAAEVRT